MTFQLEKTKQDFVNKLHLMKDVLKDKSHGKVIDDTINVIHKGIVWRLLCLLQPFYRLVGRDVYSHVRADNVARSIFQYCDVNKKYLTPQLVAEIQNDILSQMGKKTANKYKITIQHIASRFKEFLPPEPKLNTLSPIADLAQPLKWPSNLNDIDVTRSQRNSIQDVFSEIMKIEKPSVGFIKEKKDTAVSRRLEVVQPDGMKTHSVDHSFSFTSTENAITSILLLTKKVIGKGGQRIAKLCFDLLSGAYLVRKNCTSELELAIVNYLKQKPSRGITPIFALREVNKSDGSKKAQVIELFCEGSLINLFGTLPLTEAKVQLSLMGDLLHGLAHLHEGFFTSISFNSKEFTGETKRYTANNVNFFHFDLSPGNILIRRGKEGQWKAMISDFGTAGAILATGGTPGFKPPEAVAFEKRAYQGEKLSPFITDKEIAEHNIKYGQARDVWGLGCILACILAGRSSIIDDRIIPPLPSIEKCFLKSLFNRPLSRVDENTADLKQEDIDRDIALTKKDSELANPLLPQLWDLVAMMLKVNPEERASVHTLLEKYNAIDISGSQLEGTHQ